MALLTGLSLYNSRTNYGYFNLNVRPLPRASLSAGYNVTSVDGDTLILNPINGWEKAELQVYNRRFGTDDSRGVSESAARNAQARTALRACLRAHPSEFFR